MLGKLLGNYRVVEQLGEGGMGVVYVGQHEALGHRVVVKVLRRELSGNAVMVQRFFNEAQAATAIRNAGIVQVFDFGTTADGRAYLVMELLEGETLAARLEYQRLDYLECCRIGRQVANVLQAAHARGITHRDLKPENLYLVPDAEVIGGERVKVLDFGIAKLSGEAQISGLKTRTGAVMGTPVYMSPEQCRSAGAVDARADIYSLGCILFEMTCGRPPFVGEGAGEIVGAHLHVPPPHPHDLAPDIPRKLAALIAQMLAKQPDARPQTMAAVGQALDEIMGALDGAPRRARTRAPAPQLAASSTTLGSSAGMTSAGAPRAARRRRLTLAGVAVASGLSAMILVIVLRGSSPAEQPSPLSASGDEPQPTAGPAVSAPEASASTPPAPDSLPTLPASPPAVSEAPPPPPPPEEPPPSPPPLPEEPQTVEVAIDSTPPGAQLVLSGAVLGRTPFRGTLPRGEHDVTIQVRLRGHAERAIVVRPDQPISRRIKLVASPRAQPPRSRDYSVNPFGR